MNTPANAPATALGNPGFFTGIGYFLRGFALIGAAGTRRFVIVPLTVNIALFIAAIWFSIAWLGGQIEQITQEWGGEWYGSVVDWLLYWVALPLALLLMLVVMFYTFTLLGNLIAAPFNGLLAEKIEARMSGERPDTQGGILALLKDIGASFLSELKKQLYFATRALPLLALTLLLFFIPLFNLAIGPLWFLFGAWMLSIEYSDFPMANNGMRFPQIRATLSARRLFALGFGMAAMTATLIPILNFFVMPAAVAGASAMWADYWRHHRAHAEEG